MARDPSATERAELERLAAEMRQSARRLGERSPVGRGLAGWATKLSLAAQPTESKGVRPALGLVGDEPNETDF